MSFRCPPAGCSGTVRRLPPAEGHLHERDAFTGVGASAVREARKGHGVASARRLRRDLWEAYQVDGADWARDELLAEHAGLVHREAIRLHQQRPYALEQADLVGAGMVGLMEAVQSFDLSRGLAFSTFATPRIRGAIIDHLRAWDALPRSARRRERMLTRGREALAAKLGRAPSAVELAEHLEVDTGTVHGWEADAMRGVQVSLDASVGCGDGGEQHLGAVIPGSDGDAVLEELNREEELEVLRRALAGLPERERRVLSLYYLEELTLKEIGALLGVTESRVSQIRSAVLAKLRDSLGRLRAA